MSALPDGYRSRPATLEDVDAVAALRKAADMADAGVDDPVRDQIAEWWSLPVVDLARDVILVEDARSAVGAFGGLFALNPEISVEAQVVVHPGHRGRGLGGWLVDALEAEVRSRDVPAPRITLEAPSGVAAARALIESRGYRYARTFWHMARALEGPVEPPSTPGEVALRPFEVDRDLRPLYDALESAFADHWNAQPFPFELHEYEMRHREAELVLVADGDGAVVGGSIARLSEGAGWIDALAVVREWRGRGVAKALLRSQFATLAARGASRVLLNVDAENTTGATRLYEAVGMQVHRSFDVFEKRFDGG
jgi:mycothiol synthase